MKVLLIAGHGAGDSGAVGNGSTEQQQTRKVVEGVGKVLQRLGVNVTTYPTSKNAFKEYQKGTLNFGGTFDYVLEIHFNSYDGNARGTEIFVTTSEQYVTVEECIMKNLSKYFLNRGVKKTNFSVIQTAKNKGLSSALLEVCFIDNYSDMQTYFKNFDGICQSIAYGVAIGFGLSTNTPAPEEKPDTGVYAYKAKYNMIIRSNPDTDNASNTGYTTPIGYTYYFDRILQGNQYTWGSYIGKDSKKRRYIAIRDKKNRIDYLREV